jgi:DNA-binding transcriptional MerR regulator
MHKPARDNFKAPLPLPDKLFYKIGEVSRIAGVEPYVLRYWETEFPFLKPRKNKSGQRVYIKKDLEMIIQVKKMLYQERYTIEGVRKRFGENIHKPSETRAFSESGVKDRRNPAEAIGIVKKRLREIIKQLKKPS